MAIAECLVGILKEEMQKHGVTKLKRVRVKHGALSGIAPEALAQAFSVCVIDTPMEDAELIPEEVPLKLKCSYCGTIFTPEDDLIALMPCPDCNEEIGHEVLEGKELYIDGMDAD